MDQFNNDVEFVFWGGNLGSTSTDLPVDDWTHVAVVRSSADNTLKIYVDGMLEDTFNTTNNAGTPGPGEGHESSGIITIGSRYTLGDALFGEIDEFGFWDTALSADNVEWLANNSLTAIGGSSAAVPEPGAIVTWSLLGAVGLAYGVLRRRKS